MPSRRDYDPVDEDPPGENNGSLRSAYEEIPVVDHESAPQDVDASHLSSSGVEEPNEDAIDSSNGMKVRVLDVHGEAYWVSVTPETTVQELKEKLVQLSGVEITRQRIIYGGKVRNDMARVESGRVGVVSGYPIVWSSCEPILPGNSFLEFCVLRAFERSQIQLRTSLDPLHDI